MAEREITRHDIIKSLDFGHRIAEEEIKQLSKYFVKTDQWHQISSGAVDIVYGPKGSGKSALYALLLDNEAEYFNQETILVSVENPRGTPIFRDLTTDPPASENEFIYLWKLYLLSLIGGVIRDYANKTPQGKIVSDALHDAGLVEDVGGIHGLFRRVVDYVRRLPQALEGTVKLDPITGAHTITGKITFEEPTGHETRDGKISVNSLLRLANEALASLPVSVWLLVDRLDVAFTDSEELEANALRALFKSYLDLMGQDQIKLKIFLRTDIWGRITEGKGFREASHITKSTTIRWDRPSLANLLIERATQSQTLLNYCGMNKEEALGARQEEFLGKLFPGQVEVGPNKPETALDWILGRTKDGKKENAPRELIHLLIEAREEELRRLDLGATTDQIDALFSRSSIKNAWREVSNVRLTQTLYPEFPGLKPVIEKLDGEKASQHVKSLAKLWDVSEEEALAIAEKLVGIGFFEKRGEKGDPEFWVPFLYRPALNLVMGKAEAE